MFGEQIINEGFIGECAAQHGPVSEAINVFCKQWKRVELGEPLSHIPTEGTAIPSNENNTFQYWKSV